MSELNDVNEKKSLLIKGISKNRHSREGGNPESPQPLDPRLRGGDENRIFRGALKALVVLFLLSTPALAIEPSQQSALQQIEARLQTAPQMLGRFEQKKTLPQLPRPLLSSGVVALSQERGVSWRVQKPIASHLILNEQRAGEDALAKQIAYPLLQIFRGNFSALDGLFHVDAEAGDEHWRVRLTPKAETLGKVIASIEISGNSAIEQIRLAEANSAVTEMQLLELRAVHDSDPQFTAEFKPARLQAQLKQQEQ